MQPDDEDVADLAGLGDRGVSLLHAFYESAVERWDLEIEDVEKRFEVEIHDPDMGEALEERLVGVIDLIASEDERRVIWEHSRFRPVACMASTMALACGSIEPARLA